MKKVAINGFGRIGRLTFQKILERGNLEILAINDLASPEVLSHLLKYDSSYGIYKKNVKAKENSIVVDGKEIKVFSEKDPEKLPWKDLEIDIVLECTGVFRDYEGSSKHLKAGAKRVIISAPAKSEEIPSFILGVNEDKFNPEKDLICDMGSCTTNCLAPVIKVLNDNFRVKKAFMTTIHSYTMNQRLLDGAHKDLRRARAAALNIIPTTTGAAKAIFKVIPELKGKIDAISIRVPTPTVSLIDLVCELEKEVTAEEINFTFKKASKEKRFEGILGIEDAPLVSSDFKGNTFSAIVDALSTKAIGNLVKVLAWYDNEAGYATRLAEFAEFVAERI